MITIDIEKFIKNRMWFGWWFSYRSDANLRPDGTWQRDRNHHRVPIILVSDIIGSDKTTSWALLYDDV